MAPPPPRSLPYELVEDILLRFPPDEPVRLVHAALVCKTWCAIVSGAGFRRRFREFHRTPPLLGFVSNFHIQGHGLAAEFVPTCSLPASRVHRGRGHVCVADARHGRVLLYRISYVGSPPKDLRPDALMVWDPTTDEQEEVPAPPVARYTVDCSAAAVLCAGRPCDHLDCRRGPVLIVFVGYDLTHSETVLCTYSSSTASWSKPISSYQLPFDQYEFSNVAHVENSLYFGVLMTNHILKFDLESQEISCIQLPTTFSSKWLYVLNTTEGGGLGLATIHSSKLYMWSRDDVSQVDATWTQNRVIELKTLLPVHAVLASPRLLGFTVGIGVIFVWLNNVLYVIDLNTNKVTKKVCKATLNFHSIVPYMSFYTPVALGAVSTGEGP